MSDAAETPQGTKPAQLAIRREIEIEAPPERVWPHVATQDGLRRWWAESTKRLVLEEREGGRFELVVEFGRDYTIVGRVVTYDRPRAFAVTWREMDGDAGEWPADTLVTFRLDDLGGRTRVVVEHTGFERLPEAIREAMVRSYEHGWTDEEMERLHRQVLTEGA